MRIHRLRLSNVKGVTDREVAFPDHGVIVLEGPNEIGKTTMIEALDVLLEEKDSSRKRHVLAPVSYTHLDVYKRQRGGTVAPSATGVRFLHTSDWQLGMTRHFLQGEAQARYAGALSLIHI